MEALQLTRLPVVDLEDYPLGLVEPGLVVAHRGAGHQQPVRQGRGHLHDRHVELAVEAEPHVLRGVAQVGIDVANIAGVDHAAQRGVGVVRQPGRDPIGSGQYAVGVGCRRRAGPQPDLELPSLVVGLDHGCGQRGGDRLGIAGAGEPAEPHVVAVVDVRHGLFGRDHLRG